MAQQANDEQRRVVVGRIVGVHGVRGWVKVESWTQPRDNLFGFETWQLEDDNGVTTVRLQAGRPGGRGLIAALEGYEDRDQARAIMGAQITVPRSELPSPAQGEYYWVDLEGLAVTTIDGVELGTVSHLFETGANDVMVVRGDRERLIPFVPEVYVRHVDLEAGWLEVDWDPAF